MMFIEHPRPDFRREKWLSLLEKWLFRFDEKEQLKIKDTNKPEDYPLEIKTPYPYQSKLSGIEEKKDSDVVWYGRQFKIVNQMLERYNTILLRFGAVDYETHVWLNGTYLGSHIGGYDSFSFNVSKLIQENNFLILKVIDRHGDQPRGKQTEKRKKPGGIFYTRVTGIWQPVWLEFIKGNSFIEFYQIQSKINGEIKLAAKINAGIEKNMEMEVSISHGATPVEDMVLRVNKDTIEGVIEIDDVYLWSPEDPNLYDLKLTLKENGNVLDVVDGYFGIREVRLKGGKILLNNKPIYLQFALEQGYYHDGIYTPKDYSQFLKDLKAVLELGFNGVRAHQKPPDPRYLYFADSLGLLVWEEMADWGIVLKKKNINIFLQQWQRIIIRDFNHPCVIAWVPLNERSEPSNNQEAQEFVRTVYIETKKIDPTRPVVDTSGWTHVKTDILDIHDYLFCMRTGREYSEILNTEDIWKPIVDGTETIDIGPEPFKISLPGAYMGQPIVISEFGGWGIEGQKPIVSIEPYVYETLADAFRLEMKYKDIVTAISTAPHISGYCYTQLYDVEGELNGLLTYDRQWKIDPQKIKFANMLALKRWQNEMSKSNK